MGKIDNLFLCVTTIYLFLSIVSGNTVKWCDLEKINKNMNTIHTVLKPNGTQLQYLNRLKEAYTTMANIVREYDDDELFVLEYIREQWPADISRRYIDRLYYDNIDRLIGPKKSEDLTDPLDPSGRVVIRMLGRKKVQSLAPKHVVIEGLNNTLHTGWVGRNAEDGKRCSVARITHNNGNWTLAVEVTMSTKQKQAANKEKAIAKKRKAHRAARRRKAKLTAKQKTAAAKNNKYWANIKKING